MSEVLRDPTHTGRSREDPVEPELLPVMRPKMPGLDRVIPYLESMNDRRVFSNFGPLVTKAERRIASWLDVDASCVVLVANATQGLVGALENSEMHTWETPVYTFAATAQSVLQAGRTLRFQDIDRDSWIAQSGQGTETSAPGGVLPVVPFGANVDLNRWADREYVIVDAAASLGNPPASMQTLKPTWAVVFSLHATKVLPAGEGGVVVCGSAERAERFRSWTNFGFASDRSAVGRGTNAKMSEIAGAYVNASLDEWAQTRQEWLTIREFASNIAQELGIQPTALPGDEVSPYWVVQLKDQSERDHVERNLHLNGMETRRWWPTLLTQMSAFQGFADQGFPNAKHVSETILGLPFHREMTSRDFRAIEQVLSKVLREYREDS